MHLSHAVAFLLSAWAVAAFDPSDRRACDSEDYDFCLTSFVWCARPNDDVKGCSFPENTYPYFDRDKGSNPALLLWSRNYTLSWKKTDDKYPVQLRWFFMTETNPYKSGYVEKNITKGITSLDFTFEDLANQLSKSSGGNYSAADIKGFAGDATNSLQISQPDKYRAMGAENRFDTSDQFAVVDSTVRRYLMTQSEIAQRETYHKWKLGVGIGVGVGVPILMVVSMVVGWCLGKRGRTKRTWKSTSPRQSME
ncbi:glyoxalase family [Purpureocillium lavendulum]|uniref:Glyoxalase family n=1 Tax=Purpureocillium lavendulum TaxID=1247861 RepID=A0AB34FN57_9HYPO|nr:glyoxalase family [Purpureocillium lavendulum]